MSTATSLQSSWVSSVEAGSGSPPSALSSSISRSSSAAPAKQSHEVLNDTKSQYGVLLDTYGHEFKVPDFTIKQIRDAIPAHCFERSALRGYGYVARDVLLLATNFYLFSTYITPSTVPSSAARFVFWSIYGFLQGLFGTGIWVLAHECGHQSFSTSKIINDTTGWILHSALLVPYFSWKISHGKHHKSTGHMERDTVFLPKTREVYASKIGKAVHELSELAEETPIVTALILFGRQLVGWAMYLLQNNTGHNNHERQSEGRGLGKSNGFFGGVNHFSPSSPLFEAKDAKLIVLSDIGLACTASVLYCLGSTYGWSNLLTWYLVPYLWVNHWLVAITFLQHTDPSVAHYGPSTWSFARGAAATVDREFGFIGRQLLHGIIETHVLHHYVSTIPFYHADEATAAIKPIMGQHYRSDTKGGSIGFLKSLWTSARWCQWVEPSKDADGPGRDIVFYRNRNGLGVKPITTETL